MHLYYLDWMRSICWKSRFEDCLSGIKCHPRKIFFLFIFVVIVRWENILSCGYTFSVKMHHSGEKHQTEKNSHVRCPKSKLKLSWLIFKEIILIKSCKNSLSSSKINWALYFSLHFTKNWNFNLLWVENNISFRSL